jgi:hypothetical protein
VDSSLQENDRVFIGIIRDVGTSPLDSKIINRGRARLNGLGNLNSDVCFCPTLNINPDGVLFECGCLAKSMGTVFEPMVPESYIAKAAMGYLEVCSNRYLQKRYRVNEQINNPPWPPGTKITPDQMDGRLKKFLALNPDLRNRTGYMPWYSKYSKP